MVKVRVPATSANMGAGFDTLGVALTLYSNLEIEETDGGLHIFSDGTVGTPAEDTTNLVYRAMKRLFDEVGYSPKGLRITEKSNIPMTRGLGSSSACIVGGMLAANEIAKSSLERADILDIAERMEGHPDNVTPAMCGGFCAAAVLGDHVIARSVPIGDDVTFAVMIPDFQLATKQSRNTLPEYVKFRDAVNNISAAVAFFAAMSAGDYDMLRVGVNDRLHQRYRKESIYDFDEIFRRSYEAGAKATYLSGSGPTIVSILTTEAEEFETKMRRFFNRHRRKWDLRMLKCDNDGAVLIR